VTFELAGKRFWRDIFSDRAGFRQKKIRETNFDRKIFGFSNFRANFFSFFNFQPEIFLIFQLSSRKKIPKSHDAGASIQSDLRRGF
jgi:hypothetical protein